MTKLFRRFWAMTMAATLAVSGMPMSATVSKAETGGTNLGDTPTSDDGFNAGNQTASGRDDSHAKEIDGTWMFGGKSLSADKALAADYSSWQQVTIPHTWNALDGEDGGGNYVRAAYWYHKEIQVDAEMLTKKVYIEFLGANQKTDLYVNGTKVGETHKGGYTTFRYDVTKALKEGTNRLDVCVDNTYDQTIAPISGDFNMYGGIYRRVYLVTVDDVHVDLENNGSSGLFLTTENMRSKEAPEKLGEFNVKADIVNSSNTEKTVDVVVSVKGDNAPEAFVKQITIPAGGTYPFSKDCKVENPTLWEGIRYEKDSDDTKVGYQYEVSLEIKDGTTKIDEVKDKIGFRYFWIDSSQNGEAGEGFYLNGKKYPLRGVNRHSFLAKVGSAMTEQQHANDMEIMKELGINTVRLCHYPQTDYFYDLCDKNGIIVWTEIPVVNEVRNSNEFVTTTKQQLTELISQQYNRPSVCFWGLENEIGNGQSLTNATANVNLASAKKLMFELDGLAKQLDPTGRFSTQALNRDYGMNQNDADSVNKNFENNTGWKSDVVAWNIYPGWYPDANFYGTFEDVMKRKGALDSRSMGISEYGWGANVNQHEAYPELGVNGLSSGGAWHPEEYQNLMNEEAVSYINTHDELWGTFYWAMFDFAVDGRNEGSQVALNDKGLVTADRKTKKDSYYLYKANWNKKDSFTYITSRRWNKRDDSSTYIKVYSNCDEVELFMNNESLGKMTSKGNGVFLMEDVNLAFGNVEIKAIGTYRNQAEKYTDTCTWTRELCKRPDLVSKTFPVDTTQKTVIVENSVTLKKLREELTGVNNAVYKVYNGETEVTEDETLIVPGMKIHVVAEDGVTEADYSIISSNLCVNKSVTASTVETGNEAANAVDGNSASKWVASSGAYPQNITVDLEKSYYLGDLTIDWDYRNGARYYGYTVSVSEDGKEYTEILNRKDNTKSESFPDSLLLSKARYIRVDVTGCNQAGWASIFEIKADGYRIDSDQYTVDESHQLIILDSFPETGLAEGTFASGIHVSGNYDYRINLSSGWIKEGNTIDILDGSGNVVTQWTICSEANAEQYYKDVPVEKVALNETNKTMAVNGTFQLKPTILPLTATDKKVTYQSGDTSVATVSNTGLVTAKKVGKTTITVSSANGKTATCTIIVKDFSKITPVVELKFDKNDEVDVYKNATITADPDDTKNKVLKVDETAGGMNGNYAVAKADLSKYDFSAGLTVSLNVRPTANSSDWNYLFAIGQTKSHGAYNYCDGTIGFIARHGDPYEAHFPGDGWAEGNPVDSSYDYFQNQDHANKWYRLTYVYSPTETCIYMDGKLACRWSESSSITSVLKAINKGHLVLGAGASEGDFENMGGYLDDVYVYNEALDANSIPYIGKTSAATPDTPIITDKPNTQNPAVKPNTSQSTGTVITAKKKEKNKTALNIGLKVNVSGKKIKVKWGKVAGADGYLVYAQYTNNKKYGVPMVVKGKNSVQKTFTKINGKAINQKKIYKVKVAAYVQNGQSKTTIGESMTCYVAGAKNKKYTNVKSVKLKKTSLTIKKGKNATIKATVNLVSKKKKNLPNSYGKKLVYKTSNSSIATVSSDGKVKAKKKGKCTIYIFTRSGFARSVKVQVK